MMRQARAIAADLAGRESLRRSDDVDARDLERACSAMSSSDTLRSLMRVPARVRGCVVFDTGVSAARAKRKHGGQQLYVVQMAGLMLGVPATQVSTGRACVHRARMLEHARDARGHQCGRAALAGAGACNGAEAVTVLLKYASCLQR